MPRLAAGWLAAGWPHGAPATAELAHRALALALLCRTADAATVEMLAPVVADALERRLDFARLDVVTALLSALLAAEEGHDGACAYLGLLKEVAASLPAGNAEVVAVRTALGLDAPIREPAELRLVDLGPRWFAAGSAGGLRETLATVELHSELGIRRVLADDPIPCLLEGAALRCTQRYDLLQAPRCLRACAYLGASKGIAFEEAASFLASVRRVDGSFGFFDGVFAVSGPAAAPGAGAQMLLVKSAVLLQCLWALTELRTPAWRLFSALRTQGAMC